MRVMEAFIVVLVSTIGLCLGAEIVLSRPDLGAVAAGFVPSLPGDQALYLAIGILGATVMPHNLYLHSALVQSRRIVKTPAGIRASVRFNIIDSAVALNGAFFVNAALLVMAAATFHRAGHLEVGEIQEAHRLLEPILGARFAPVAFAVALIASGQSSTITGTLAGQIVMEGFVRIRLRPLVRRLITRALALAPALATIILFGEGATGKLLVFSQVILSLQLSFAVIPLVHLVSDRRWMGSHVVGVRTQVAGWMVAGIIVFLNLQLAVQEVLSWASSAGPWAWLVWCTVLPAGVGLGGVLLYVAGTPALQRWRGSPRPEPLGVHGQLAVPDIRPAPSPRRIAVALDFSPVDGAVLSQALAIARASGRGTTMVLLHVVESGGALAMGSEMQDWEALQDRERLDLYCGEFIQMGIDASCALGFGDPAEALARLVEEHAPDLLVVGGHGHRFVGDIMHGTTVDRLRHRIRVPLLVVPAAPSRASPISEEHTG
jgi:manganese transport protein